MKVKDNFIEQMFQLEVLRKSDNKLKKYFGIHEVVKGKDFAQSRSINKYETHIDKVLSWPLKKENKKEISHFSIQSFTTFLKNTGKLSRDEETDDRYYPFILEFESQNKNEDTDVLFEVANYIQYLMADYNVNEKDIIQTITNSKSVYVWVNPKVFGLKQGKNLHKVYNEMYKHIKEELGLKFVDESVVNSSYRLIKTPGSYYKGGFVSNINLDEFMMLMAGQVTREELTSKQRDIRKLQLPGVVSLKLANLYKKCKNKVEKKKYKEELTLPGEVTCSRQCIKKLINMPFAEKGNRNSLLVSIALGLIELNYTQSEVERILVEKAAEWNHDENKKAVLGKVKSLIRNKTKFSCDKAKALFEEEGLNMNCAGCKSSMDNIFISRNIIQTMYKNKASKRNYLLYLELEKKNLIGEWFTAEEIGFTRKTINELAKTLDIKIETKDNEFKINFEREKSIYRLPKDFIETTAEMVGRKLANYLALIVISYNGNEKAVFISMGIKTLTNYLGYENERSIYKFLNTLEDLGLLKFNKTKGLTMFFKNNKVIDINEKKEEKIIQKEIKSIENYDTKKVVNGTQLNFEFENNNISRNIPEVNYEFGNMIRMDEKKTLRGSPPDD